MTLYSVISVKVFSALEQLNICNSFIIYTCFGSKPYWWCDWRDWIECGGSLAGHIKDKNIGICCLCTNHAALRIKSKDWPARSWDNVFEWSGMSTRVMLFQ